MEKAKESKETKKGFGILRTVKNTIFGGLFAILVVIVAVILVTRINGEIPSLFGHSVYRVSSGSMEPALKVGDVIVIKACDFHTIKKGDIITYRASSGYLAGNRVTHRVIKEPFLKNGEYYIRTQGDANNIADKDFSVEDIVGIYVCKIPLLDMLYSFFITPWGLLTIIALIILAFFNEIINFFRALFGDIPDDEERESVQDIIERIQAEEAAKADEAKKSEKAEKVEEAENKTPKNSLPAQSKKKGSGNKSKNSNNKSKKGKNKGKKKKKK